MNNDAQVYQDLAEVYRLTHKLIRDKLRAVAAHLSAGDIDRAAAYTILDGQLTELVTLLETLERTERVAAQRSRSRQENPFLAYPRGADALARWLAQLRAVSSNDVFSAASIGARVALRQLLTDMAKEE